MNKIDTRSLPAEILKEILDRIPWREQLKIRLGCKQIHQLNGRYFRHFTLRHRSLDISLSPFAVLAPNCEHLKLESVHLNDVSVKQLAKIVPHLKSLEIRWSNVGNCGLGLVECFKKMQNLEYLNIWAACDNLTACEQFSLVENLYYPSDQLSSVHFPSNLKYLDLSSVNNTEQVLNWVADSCKNLQGLRLMCMIDTQSILEVISQMESLTYLGIPLDGIRGDFSFFESLTQLRALEIQTLNNGVLSSIAQFCKNLEHVDIWDCRKGKVEISAEVHSNLLRIATLPNLLSFSIWASFYSKKQTTELVNLLMANRNLEYIKIKTTQVEPEVLFELLRRCTKIKCIGLDCGMSDVNPQMCQVVDEIDEQYKELFQNTHPIVEVQYGSMGVKKTKRAKNNRKSYKWLRFVPKLSPPAVLEKWQYGSLSAGKP